MAAAKQGLKSGTYFWPGSEVPIEGVTFVSVMQINTHKHVCMYMYIYVYKYIYTYSSVYTMYMYIKMYMHLHRLDSPS